MLKVAYMLIGIVASDPSQDDQMFLGPFEFPDVKACLEASQTVAFRYETTEAFKLRDLQIICTSYPPEGKYKPGRRARD